MLGLGGRPPTVAEQTASLEADITTTRASQKQAQLQLEEAVHAELHALTCLDAARSIQDRARRQVQTCADAINSLQDEIAALVPVPRPAP